VIAPLEAAARETGRTVYAAVLRACYTRTGLPWAVHDAVLRIDPRVRHLVPHANEPEVFRFIHQSIAPGDAVLDVGAFLGVYAILEARLAGPDGRVIAFEPTPWSAAIARRHFRYNHLGPDRLTLIEAAVSDRPGRGVLHEYPEPYVNSLSLAVDSAAAPRATAVAMVTIDEMCARTGVVPSFIRMDVQGAELHALRGAVETIRAAGRRVTLVVEMHPQCWPSFGVTPGEVRDAIEDLGLEAAPLEAHGDPFGVDAHAVLRPRRA